MRQKLKTGVLLLNSNLEQVLQKTTERRYLEENLRRIIHGFLNNKLGNNRNTSFSKSRD